MFSFKNYTTSFLSIFISFGLGLVFIYSGYSKLFPVIETFEFTFVDTGIANWYSAPIMARLMIGLEFFLGILFILNYRLKKFTLPLAILLLLFFIIYLLLQISNGGSSANCGCFGEHIKMTPVQAIIKNIIMLAGCFIVYFLFEGWSLKHNKLVLSFLLITSVAVPFIINPVDYTYSSNNLEEKVDYPLELDLLYQPADTSKVEIPNINLKQGKHVLAFLSLTCSHCRIAAKKLRIIKKNNPQLSIYFILNGDRKNYKPFIDDTRADNIPYTYCLGKTFVQLASAQLPRIYYLDKGWVVKKVDYYELNQYHIENWVNKEEL